MDAMVRLLGNLGIPDPVESDEAGVFPDATLQKLHDDLVARGKRSSIDALLVGAGIEDLDIVDLRKTLVLTEDADVRRVLENLERGSRNHLRAFTSLLRAEGVTYAPVHLGQAEYDTILASKHERGRDGAGARQGGGRGRHEGERAGGRGRGQGRSRGEARGRGRGGRDGGCRRECSRNRDRCRNESRGCDADRGRGRGRNGSCDRDDDRCDDDRGRGRGRGRRGR
jgi:hypothetical protein